MLGFKGREHLDNCTWFQYNSYVREIVLFSTCFQDSCAPQGEGEKFFKTIKNSDPRFDICERLLCSDAPVSYREWSAAKLGCLTTNHLTKLHEHERSCSKRSINMSVITFP